MWGRTETCGIDGGGEGNAGGDINGSRGGGGGGFRQPQPACAKEEVRVRVNEHTTASTADSFMIVYCIHNPQP